ncbi:hypothetical protein RvY_04804-2 [Ramazzottius varieornatus]|uniref:SET domain-containing protein n=1 Tax=Ramazzottius varieornatus TaxID=947166 RepID=A0A1D1UTI2_RAMVA|nr:hypothetical protein RvY_04804-2 [Ramazzottius varieornatus]
MEHHMNAVADKESELSTRCGSCREHENGPCILHCRDLVPDTEFSRAICTLPSQLAFHVIQQPAMTELSNSKGIILKESRTVVASQSIPPGTVYGPLVADVVISTKKTRGPSRFGVNLGGSVIREYSLDSDLTCNWMKYVRLSHIPTKVNLMAYQHGESVYFTVVKSLAAGDELCVGYSPAYAESIGRVGAEGPNVSVLNAAPTPQKTFWFALASDSTSNSVSLAKRPGKKRKRPEDQSPPRRATIQLKADRLRDLLPKPAESLAFTEAVQQVVKDAQQQLNQLNEVNRIRSVQINTIEHLGSDRFDNNNFESNILPIRDVGFPPHRREKSARRVSAQSGLVSVGSGTFLLPGAHVHSTPLAELDSERDMKAESPVASTDFFGGRDEENMDTEESDADSDRTWSLPTVEEPEKKKKSLTRTLTIPQKLLRLKSSLPEADDEVSALPVSRKKKAAKNTKKEMGDLRPEESQKTDEIISGTVENDLLWNALLTQTPVPPPKKRKKKKKKVKAKSKAVEEQEVSEVLLLDSEKDKPKKVPRVPKPRPPRARIDRRTSSDVKKKVVRLTSAFLVCWPSTLRSTARRWRKS